MKKSKVLFLVFALLIVFTFLPVQAQTAQTLTVFAAASLTDAFGVIGSDFEVANPGVDIVYNFGGSSTLATQIVEGASADVFASANNRQMAVVQDAGLGATPARTFVKNRLVVVVPAGNPANIQTLSDLANPGVRLVVAAPEVPVREYTDSMLERMAANALYGAAYQTAVIGNIVSEEENVRQVLVKVTLGEADAGIVYVSDVTPDIADQVLTIAIPDQFNTIATYPIAVLTTSPNPELAQLFIDYVLSDAGQDTLVAWNFISVRIPELSDTVILAEDGNLYIGGQVLNAFTLTVEDLRNNYASQTIEVTYQSGDETITTTFTGVLLWDVLGSAQVNLNADQRNDKLSLYIIASAPDRYQAVIAWGEIDPEFGNQPILVAYEQDGQPIIEDGPFRLIVPSDIRGGRYVSNLASLEVRDAPTVNN